MTTTWPGSSSISASTTPSSSARCARSRGCLASPEGLLRGRLHDATAAPAVGEVVESLLDRGRLRIEHILSGDLEAPVDYRQDEDEWVLLLSGSARLRVGETQLELGAGDWLFLPAGLEHRLEWTAPGSTWLAVYVAPP